MDNNIILCMDGHAVEVPFGAHQTKQLQIQVENLKMNLPDVKRYLADCEEIDLYEEGNCHLTLSRWQKSAYTRKQWAAEIKRRQEEDLYVR